jgi:hydroxyacylglutathione hydrolase
MNQPQPDPPRWQHSDLRTVLNGPHHSNSYLLRGTDGERCVVIDPGLDPAALQAAIAECGWLPAAVLCTHGHFDHVGGAAWLQAQYGLPVLLHAADFKLARMANFLMAAFKMPQRIELPRFTALGDEGAVHCIAGLNLKVHTLPGHTPGSVGLAVGGLLFSGDSLYARRIALSQLPGEDHARLRESLAHLFSWLDGGVRVLPGHGGSATVDEIHAHNTDLRHFMAATLQVTCPTT